MAGMLIMLLPQSHGLHQSISSLRHAKKTSNEKTRQRNAGKTLLQ